MFLRLQSRIITARNKLASYVRVILVILSGPTKADPCLTQKNMLKSELLVRPDCVQIPPSRGRKEHYFAFEGY